jgi:hypothetical protein
MPFCDKEFGSLRPIKTGGNYPEIPQQPVRYAADYPISRDLLHWESQSNTARASATGQNLIDHQVRGYTILAFARSQKNRNGCTVPFIYLGPIDRLSHESERPIKMIWRLRHPMPVEMFEENKRGG